MPTSYSFTFADGVIRSAITTTTFVQMVYKAPDTAGGKRRLMDAFIVAIPNGMLESRYAASANDTIWRAGKHSPRRGEDPRTRISVSALRAKALWRVQRVGWDPEGRVYSNWVDLDEESKTSTHKIVADTR